MMDGCRILTYLTQFTGQLKVSSSHSFEELKRVPTVCSIETELYKKIKDQSGVLIICSPLFTNYDAWTLSLFLSRV